MALPYIIAPAGVTPASFFSPAIFVDPGRPPAILADNIDPATGDIKSLLVRVHPVDAAIGEAFRIKRATGAAVSEIGQRFEDVRKNTAFASKELENEARRIMEPFVLRGDAAIISILVDTTIAFDLGAVAVNYTNLRTGRPQTVRGRAS